MMPASPGRLRAIALLVLTAAAGCASSGPRPTAAAEPGAAPASSVASAPNGIDPALGVMGVVARPESDPQRRDRQVLLRDEILATEFRNLYDVVLALRANWVRVRAADSFEKSTPIQVYLDMQRLTGVDELRTMHPMNIASIRYLDPIQASARYGLDHGAGAILVSTSRP